MRAVSTACFNPKHLFRTTKKPPFIIHSASSSISSSSSSLSLTNPTTSLSFPDPFSKDELQLTDHEFDGDHKSTPRTNFVLMGDDAGYDELKTTEGDVTKVLSIEEDLPGMGQFYCLHCDSSRYFAKEGVRDGQITIQS